MDSSWSYALDMSAASGLLDYDAAARITGQKARFVGNPNMSDLDNKPLYLPKKLNFNSSSPEADEFQKESDGKGNYINNPTWKKVLTCIKKRRDILASCNGCQERRKHADTR